MPELPEVARSANGLNSRLASKQLESIELVSGRYRNKGTIPGLELLQFPVKILSVKFYGKMVVFEMMQNDKPLWCINTYGMTGLWSTNPDTKSTRIKFTVDGNDYYYCDTRNFGTLKFTDDPEMIKDKIASKGPNHISSIISDELFKDRLMKKPNNYICQALMNQGLIGGIGNYIKAEVLYRSGISPYRKVKEISDDEFSKLNANTKDVILSSYNRGNPKYTNGTFKLHVYGRQICEQGFQVVRETTPDKRTTHWVKDLQK